MGGGVLNSVPSPVPDGQLKTANSVVPSKFVPAAMMVVWQITEGRTRMGEGGVVGDALFLG